MNPIFTDNFLPLIIIRYPKTTFWSIVLSTTSYLNELLVQNILLNFINHVESKPKINKRVVQIDQEYKDVGYV